MADLFPVAGCRLFIGPVTETQADNFIASDFTTMDTGAAFVEIDGWETMGQVGDAAALITTALINRGRDVKQKGTRNAGSMQNNFAIIADDPGQIALYEAEASTDNYAFKIQGNDRLAPAGDDSLVYFIGLVTSAQETGGSANTVRMLSSTIEVNSNVVRIAATAS